MFYLDTDDAAEQKKLFLWFKRERCEKMLTCFKMARKHVLLVIAIAVVFLSKKIFIVLTLVAL